MNFLRTIFGGEKESISADETPTASPQPITLPPGLHVSMKTDVGQQRERNEDALYTLTSFIHSNDHIEPFGVFIVADGMGGYKGGEKASSIAAKTAASYLLQNIYLPDLIPAEYTGIQLPINELLPTAINEANDAVLKYTPESGTTLTIAVVIDRQIYLAHVGDSRAYIYQDGRLEQITQDHSVVARMVEVGQLTAEEALTHQNRNVLYRAIGQANTLEAEVDLRSLPAQGQLLLCSDGLWNLVLDDEIIQVLKESSSLDESVNQLVALANQKGGDDNITVVLIAAG
jgi:protein phosphatase